MSEHTWLSRKRRRQQSRLDLTTPPLSSPHLSLCILFSCISWLVIPREHCVGNLVFYDFFSLQLGKDMLVWRFFILGYLDTTHFFPPPFQIEFGNWGARKLGTSQRNTENTKRKKNFRRSFWEHTHVSGGKDGRGNQGRRKGLELMGSFSQPTSQD